MLADSLQVALRTDRVMWGADSPVVGDGAQYLGLVWDASRDLVVGNPFDGLPDTRPRQSSTPAGSPPACLHAIGLPAALALLRVQAGRVRLGLPGRAPLHAPPVRRAASSAAWRSCSPAAAEPGRPAGILLGELAGDGVGWIGSDSRQLLSMSRELYPLAQLWGYPWAAIAIGLMPLVAARLRARAGARAPAAAGSPRPRGGAALAAWLHPWQGATILVDGGSRRRARAPPPAPAAGASRGGSCPSSSSAPPRSPTCSCSTAWTSSPSGSRRLLDGGFWRPQVIAAALLPVLVPALLAYRVPARDFQERAVRWWPAVALFVYVQPAGHVPQPRGRGAGAAARGADGDRGRGARLGQARRRAAARPRARRALALAARRAHVHARPGGASAGSSTAA